MNTFSFQQMEQKNAMVTGLMVHAITAIQVSMVSISIKNTWRVKTFYS